MSVSLRKLPVLVAGVSYAVAGLLQLRHTQPDQHWSALDRWIEAAFAVALVTSVAAVTAERDLCTTGRTGRIGTRIAQVGFGAMAVASVASLVHGGNVIGAAFGLGLLAALVGLGTLAVAGVRDRRLRWPAPMLLVAFLVGMVLGDNGGTVLIGVGWLGLGWLVVEDAPSPLESLPAR